MSSTVNSTVFKIFLPVLIGLAIFATLDSIKVNSLDPSVNGLQSALSSMDRSVTFGDVYTIDKEEEEKQLLNEKSKEKSKQEVREAILFNIFVAQNCNLLKPVNEADWSDIPDSSQNPEQDEVYIEGGADESFEISKEEELSLTCIGAESIKNLVKPSADTLASPDTGDSKTNDMEGKFGRINFDTENTINFDSPKVASASLYKDSWGQVGNNFPGFWRNDRVVTMIPENLVRENCDEFGYDKPLKTQARIYHSIEEKKSAFNPAGNNGDINAYQGNWGKNALIYAFRLRTNMPIVKEGYTRYRSEHSFCGQRSFSRMKDFLFGSNRFLDGSPPKRILCEDASGYIQSNAGRVNNDGETSVDTIDIVRDYGTEVVFPKMLITSNKDDCLDEFTYDKSEVAAIKIDKGGERRKCSFEEAKQGYSMTWKGAKFKCGLYEEQIRQRGKGIISFYNTAWIKDKSACEKKKFGVTGTFHKRGDLSKLEGMTLYPDRNSINYQDSEVIMDKKSKKEERGGLKIEYDLQRLDADSLNLVYEDLNGDNSNIEIKLTDTSSNEYKIKRSDTITGTSAGDAATEWKISKNGNVIGRSDYNSDKSGDFNAQKGSDHRSTVENLQIDNENQLLWNERYRTIEGDLEGLGEFNTLVVTLKDESKVKVSNVEVRGKLC